MIQKLGEKFEKKVENFKIVNTLYIFQQAYAYSKVASNRQEAIDNNRNAK